METGEGYSENVILALGAFPSIVGGALAGPVISMLAILGYGILQAYHIAGRGCSLDEELFIAVLLGVIISIIASPVAALLGAISGASILLWLTKKRFRRPLVVFYALIGLAGLSFFAYSLIVSNVETPEITQRYTEFQLLLDHSNYSEAYNFMSPSYQQGNDIEEFRRDFTYSGLEEIRTRDRIKVNGRTAWVTGTSSLCTNFGFAPTLQLKKEGGIWYFTGESYISANEY